MADSWIAYLIPSDPTMPGFCLGPGDKAVRREARAERFPRQRDAELMTFGLPRRLGRKYGCGYAVVALPAPSPTAESPRA